MRRSQCPVRFMNDPSHYFLRIVKIDLRRGRQIPRRLTIIVALRIIVQMMLM